MKTTTSLRRTRKVQAPRFQRQGGRVYQVTHKVGCPGGQVTYLVGYDGKTGHLACATCWGRAS